jgi:hypothetical protein
MDKNRQKPPLKRPILSLKASRKPVAATQTPTFVAAPQIQEQSRRADRVADQLAGWLCQHSAVWRNFQPLNIGVISEVYDLLQIHGMRDVWSKRIVHKALRWHTTRTDYWKNLLVCSKRYGLDGQIGGGVTQEQKDWARSELEARIAAGKTRLKGKKKES